MLQLGLASSWGFGGNAGHTGKATFRAQKGRVCGHVIAASPGGSTTTGQKGRLCMALELLPLAGVTIVATLWRFFF